MASVFLHAEFFLFITACYGQTNDSSNIPSSSSAPTLPSITTSSIQMTSKAAVTSAPVTAVSASSGSQARAQTTAGFCGCDLSPAPDCSPNCCCDTDCSEGDVAVFTACLDAVNRTNDRVCVSEHIIAISNVKYQTEKTNNPSLFCVYTDNNPSRKDFATPDLVTSTDDFDSRVSDFSTHSFQIEQTSATVPGQYYRFGDPIVTVLPSDFQAYFSLPKALDTTECRDTNMAAFLKNEVTECIRIVGDLATDCASLPALDSNSYSQGFKVAQFPVLKSSPTGNGSQAIFNGSNTIPIHIDHPINCIVSENPRITRACNINDTLPHPVYNILTNQCDNVAREISYVITHNATEGIVSVSLSLALASVPSSSFPLTQKYSIHFHKVDSLNAASYTRSGNPGYIVGKPVIAARLVAGGTAGSQAVQLSPQPLNWLTVVEPPVAGGDCLEIHERRSVLFGEDLRTGCVMRVTFDNITQSCPFLQTLSTTLLRGGDIPTHVAVFGNPDPANLADWVTLLVERPPTAGTADPGSGVCPNVPVNVHLEILYALTGSFTDPQAKIIGARFSYITQDIQFRCTMPFCQPKFSQMTQLIEFSSTVAFIDVSNPPRQLLKPPFRVSTELPADFFYPFYGGAAQHQHTWTLVLVGVFVSVASTLTVYC